MKVQKKTGVLIPSEHEIRVRAEGGDVLVLVDRIPAEVLNTTETVKLGLDMIRLADDCRGEFIQLKINGSPIDVLPSHARQVGAGLLRKADQADEFQINKQRVRL